MRKSVFTFLLEILKPILLKFFSSLYKNKLYQYIMPYLLPCIVFSFSAKFTTPVIRDSTLSHEI